MSGRIPTDQNRADIVASGECSELSSQLAHVITTLDRYRYRFASEEQLHAGIAQALTARALRFEHERRASPACRYDFWLPDGLIVIEAKIDGSLSQALRQVDRYAQLEDCRAVIVAATKHWASGEARHVLRDKPVRLLRLRPQAF